jgi:D-alanyl-D-alanine carboxypeptidase (penicillin-binding protein 5/6)
MYEPARRLALALSLAVATGLSAVVGLPSSAAAQPAGASEEKYAAIVVDAATGEVLYAKNADSPRHPASITKIMTLYLAFEQIAAGKLKLDDPLPVSAHAASMSPTKLGVRAGETVTVDDAMRAITVLSANDMAVALAEKIGGSESNFAALMTLRAQELGMVNTHFANASGLPDSRQISSARDIALMSRAVMRDFPQYYGYFSLHQFIYHGEVNTNHNHLLDKMQGVDGLKTGFVNASGFNLSASAVRNNHRLIAVMLGGRTASARDNHVQALLETGFDIMRRRDAGEKITLAQNMFEPAPADGPIIAPTGEVGMGDPTAKAPIVLSNVELASLHAAEGPPTGPAATVKPASPASEQAPAPKLIRVKSTADDVDEGSKARGGRRGDWMVQVGAYHRMSDARSQIASLNRKFGGDLEPGRGEVESAGHGYFRARFVGLSSSAAKNACAALRHHRLTCQALGPS